MPSIKVILACLTTAATVSALNKVSSAYTAVLNGSLPLTPELIDTMYASFLAEHRNQEPSNRDLTNYLSKMSIDRRAVFEDKVRTIIKHNTDATQTWRAGINQFSDLTNEEFRSFYHLVGDVQHCSATDRNTTKHEPLRDVPSNWDWRDFHVVTPVKDQLLCGSCWTFSTVGTLEARFIMKYG